MENKRYKDIFDAVYTGDIEAVKSFLPEHANDRCEISSLIEYAIHESQISKKEIFALLLQKGAIIDNSPYIINGLRWYNWPDLLEPAIKNGLQLDCKYQKDYLSNEVFYANHICIEYENLSAEDKRTSVVFLKEMIRLGARMDIQDQNGKLPLDYLPNEARSEIETYIANLEAEKQGHTASDSEFEYRV